MRKVLGMDIDGTLCREKCFTPKECREATPNTEIIEKLKAVREDFYVIIYTARRYWLAHETLEWLDRNNIYYDGISFRKTAVDILVDDTAITLEQFLAGDGV